MKKTDNYSLPQWEKQDFIKMEDFNDLTRKTDAALKANADATATGLNAEIAARGEAVAAEAENRSAADAALQASLAAAIGSGGKRLCFRWNSRQAVPRRQDLPHLHRQLHRHGNKRERRACGVGQRLQAHAADACSR